jgi:PPOX class probable F420-dependent enzyme
MELDRALAFARKHHNGVLATMKRDGRPQLSNITYLVRDDGGIRISITADRAKYANLRRDSRASLHVSQPDFWGYVVLDCDADVSPVASVPNDATVEELIDLYRGVQGEHPDWDDYRAAMVKDRRAVVRLRPVHAYGMIGD